MESIERWHERLTHKNAPDPDFDTAEAIKRVNRLVAWITETEDLGLNDDLDGGGSVIGSALWKLDNLEARLQYGPHFEERQIDYGPVPSVIGQMVQSTYLERILTSQIFGEAGE